MDGMTIDVPTPMTRPAQPGAARRRIAIIHNPLAGARSRTRLQAVIDRLEELGARACLMPTRSRGDATAIAAGLSHDAWDAVVVAGGDGTINEVVNGLAAGSPAAPLPPLGIIPLGTANVLALELGLPTAATDLAALLVHGPARAIHLPRANDRLLVMMAGVGFDAYVCGRVDAWLKRQLGRGAYWLTLLPALLRFPRRAYRVEIDGVAHTAASLVIANGRAYGGPYNCAPTARLTEPTVHVCLFRRAGALSIARYGLALVRGTLAARPDVAIVDGRRITVDAGTNEPVQCDGDLVVRLPLRLEADAFRLSVIAPPGDADLSAPIDRRSSSRRCAQSGHRCRSESRGRSPG